MRVNGNPNPVRRGGVVLMLGVVMCGLSGCIVEKIHDQLEQSNAGMGRVESDLKGTNAAVASVDKRLDAVDETNRLLQQTMERLAVLESIDASLKSIDASLKRLDDHLASLRKTINSIDSTIPFLKLSGDKDEEETDPAAPPAPESPAPTQPPPAPSAE